VDEDHRDAEEGEVAREAVLAIPSKLCLCEWLQVAIHYSYFASDRLLKLCNSVRTSYRFHKGMGCYGQSCARDQGRSRLQDVQYASRSQSCLMVL
jgi:hypothetical protein